MNSRVLFFFPHNLYPPRSGAHRNTLEILGGLKELGCDVTLTSSTLYSDTKWHPLSVEALKQDWVSDVRLHKPSPLDYGIVAPRTVGRRLARRMPEVDSAAYRPNGLRRWFNRVLEDVSPDVVFMNYVYWDGLLDHQRLASVRRIIHTHDLISLNNQMQQALRPHLRKSLIDAMSVDHAILQEDFFDRLGLTAQPKEIQIYDRYNYTIAVSTKERDVIREHASKTRITLMPVTQEPRYMSNSYTDAALFPIGANPFNLQGYLYFVKRVLPHVLKRVPSFSLHVTGSWYAHMRPEPEPGVVLRGFVPDLKPVYASSRFVVCPVFGMTGQQVKIVEAMAHGVPVIALAAAAESSPIRHGVNGLVARNAEEFADHVVRLWNDKDLCRRLGEAARETIANECSRPRLQHDLSVILAR